MFRKYFLAIMIFIHSFLLLTLVPLSAQEKEGKILISDQVGKEIQAEKHQYQNLSKLQTVSSDSEGIEARKEDADSSKEKTFCLSFGGGSSQEQWERGGPKQIEGLSHIPLTFRLLKFPIAIMISADYGSTFNLTTYNILYIMPLSKNKRTYVFIGGGIGNLAIDEIEGPEGMDYPRQEYTLYNSEVGFKAGIKFLGPYAKIRHSFIKGTKTWRLFILGLDFDICI